VDIEVSVVVGVSHGTGCPGGADDAPAGGELSPATSCMVGGRACSSKTEQGRGVSRSLARAAAVAHRRVTELPLQGLAELVALLSPRLQARQDA
jgi:hypothetical protein